MDSASHLRQRRLQPEWMDQPGLDPSHHAAALAGLGRLNRVSRVGGSLWRAIEHAAGPTAGRPLRVLDVASGGGDVARALWRRAQRAGREVELHGVDLSETAVRHAEARSPAGAPIRFSVVDAVRDGLPSGYDVVLSTLFFHHLTEDDAAALLGAMAAAAERAVVVSDLRRTRAGYWLSQLACRTLSRSPIVHYDGPRSVEGAFTIDEFRRLGERAGLERLSVRPQWPQRLLAVWRRTDQPT